MSPSDPTRGETEHDGELYRLVADCIERVEREGPEVLEALCRDHPEHAAALRSSVQVLLDHGLGNETGLHDGPSPPRRIRDYDLVREIGRGGMGVVYEAVQRALDRRVALKILMAHLTLDEQTVERFRREGRTAGALQHPAIVQVYDVGDAEGHYYLAMEFIDGWSIDELLARARRGDPGLLRPEDVDASVGIAATVADALEHAHAAKVIHRDVKPSNILLRPDGIPLLTDFGLARREDLPGLTRSGAIAGTPAYMSPEQASSARSVDHRTDVFSLGATLYEMVTLHRPFDGETTDQIVRSIMVREPIDPHRLNRRVSADLSAVVLKAMEKDPARRYQTAAALAVDLRNVLAGRPVGARRPSVSGRLRRWAVRQPLQATLVGVLAVGVPAITALGAYLIAKQPLVDEAELRRRADLTDAAITRGYLELGVGRADDAITELRRALELTPDSVEGIAGVAYSMLKSDRSTPSESLAYLEQQPAELSDQRVLQRLRAWCLLDLDRRAEADAVLAQLGEPREPLEAYWAGLRLSEIGAAQQRRTTREKAYGYLRDAVFMSRTARPAFHFQLAATASALRLDRDAQSIARGLEYMWPEESYAWRGIGMALRRQDSAASERAYARALQLEPGNRATRNNRANVLKDLGRVDEAIAEYRALLALEPEYGLAHYNLGKELMTSQRDPEAALPHLQRAVELTDEVGAHHYLIWVLSVLRRKDEALAAVEAAVTAHPTDTVFWRDKTNVHLDHKETAAALTACQRAIEVAPEDPQNHGLLAEVHEHCGDYQKARESFERRVELTTDTERKKRCYEDLAWFLLKTGADRPPLDAPAALHIAEYLDTIAVGKDPWALELKGAAYRHLARHDEALTALAKARARAETRQSTAAKRLLERIGQREAAVRRDMAAGGDR